MSDRERVRQVRAFRAEVRALEAEGVLHSDDPALQAASEHHERLLARLAAEGDVDLTSEAERLSTGMQVASLLGTVALSTAWAMFIDSTWGELDRTGRLLLMWLPLPLITAGAFAAARRERSGYLASIAAVVGCIAAVVALVGTDRALDHGETRWPFIGLGVYGLALGYRLRLVLPLALGIGGLGAWLWSLEGLLRGATLNAAFEYAEPAAILGAAAMAVAVRHPVQPPGFRETWRFVGVVTLITALLLLGLWGRSSWFGPGTLVETAYQVLGFAVLVLVVRAGIRADDRTLVRAGTVGLLFFLFFRMVDWFWDAVPGWLFFLLVGLAALAAQQVMQRLRRREGADGR
jgi:uncharacterized membrane protein